MTKIYKTSFTLYCMNFLKTYSVIIIVIIFYGYMVQLIVNLTFSAVSSTIVNKLGCRVVDRLGNKC